jgi:hypothetical protein
MLVTIPITIPETQIDKIIDDIMANFPEAAQCVSCIGWKYDACKFTFYDDEEGKKYVLDREILRKTFPLLYSEKWPKGLKAAPTTADADAWDDWLCQSDAWSFDAFVQLAMFGEVIYG